MSDGRRKVPTVTRPADRANDQILPVASRSCVCGHPVYDDAVPGCPLCACQDHRPRLPDPGHVPQMSVSPRSGAHATRSSPEA